MRGATWKYGAYTPKIVISIHTPHAGSDTRMGRYLFRACNFNPHSPCGERLSAYEQKAAIIHISIHTPHAGSDAVEMKLRDVFVISIHTPHAGSDCLKTGWGKLFYNFNPHSPCGERLVVSMVIYFNIEISIHTPHAGSDALLSFTAVKNPLFQSTLPMRGATSNMTMYLKQTLFQSTLPMRGATRIPHHKINEISISIHTPHAGSDVTFSMLLITISNFNPHSPCGERLFSSRYFLLLAHFNPHSPCGERLPISWQWHLRHIYFNPHSPCGERHAQIQYVLAIRQFQSTLPMRGATTTYTSDMVQISISIHTPHAGSDCKLSTVLAKSMNFNPHSPCGERPTWKA